MQIHQWLDQLFSIYAAQEILNVVFISYGYKNERCLVRHFQHDDIGILKNNLFSFLDSLDQYDYVKIDYVYQIEKKSWRELNQMLQRQAHNNHYRKGIGFDENFDIAFLEQELYGQAIIRALSYDRPNFFDQNNFNAAVQRRFGSIQPMIRLAELESVWIFDTWSIFFEGDEGFHLSSQYEYHGVRALVEAPKVHIRQLVEKNAEYLAGQILENGRMHYGRFAAYAREIKHYNTIRHCTSVYALVESLQIQYCKQRLFKIEQAIQYALDTFYIEINDAAFMIDGIAADMEIKLGANAAAILMLTKYQEITQNDTYQAYARKLADGILQLIDDDGRTTHVVHYPSLELKEKFRIIYYDGEAAFALLRLYQQHADEKLFITVRKMFDRFIVEKYERFHDHWLSYCVNELTKICPEEKYFEFGLKNYSRHLFFIRQRKTAYATLLELMMAAYMMLRRMEKLGLAHLLEQAQFNDLKKLIHYRVDFQRTGFFYPEVAMYMARPDLVLNAFYVRHDRFRVRIDDQEHNLSGYIAFLLNFENDEQSETNES